MGLGFSHGEAHWAYSGFMRFRSRLAETLGYTVPLSVMYDDGSYTRMKNEPIWPLINHSDCDGELTVEEMQQILPQLEDLVNRWDDHEYDKITGLQLIEGMKDAINNDESMEFI